jgi:nucleotide-binding universal stress UspA family protein
MAAVDISDHSAATVRYSVRLCMALEAELLLVSVINQRDRVMVQHCMAWEAFSFPDYLPERKSDRLKYMQKLFKVVSPSRLRCRYTVKYGIPYRELLTVINDETPDLMVLGSKGRSNLADMVVGSTARQMHRRSPIPLISIPADFEERLSSDDYRSTPTQSINNYRTPGIFQVLGTG